MIAGEVGWALKASFPIPIDGSLSRGRGRKKKGKEAFPRDLCEALAEAEALSFRSYPKFGREQCCAEVQVG